MRHSHRRAQLLVAVVAVFCGAASAADVPGVAHDEWPFRPPARPPLPAVAAPVENPVDAFVVARLEAAGLTLNERADRLTLLRRVTFDLTGLPPGRGEQDRFLADEAPDAFPKLVDRLLASPQYGERWAQHWLDVVRYAETEGFKADTLRPNAFRYRDYVIRSLNRDRPYDEFIRQQLAGDELEAHNPEALIATGLNRLYPDENNAANLFQRRQEILDDVTETTGLAFMGLTMGCAKCHDHKFDDILQTDYYRLQAFFVPLVECDDIPAATPEEREEYERRHRRWEEATQAIRDEIDALFAAEREKAEKYNLTKFRPEIRECVHTPESERTPLEQQIALMALRQVKWRFDPQAVLKKLPEEQQRRYEELETRLREFDHLKPAPLPGAMAVTDVGRRAPPTHLLAAGSWHKPKGELQPGFPAFLDLNRRAPPRPDVENSTGRRAALARWLGRDDHPLTARVIVNRLWHHHFGRGIVATTNDFGVMGESPSHPALLDWLAVELVEHGWSLKHIHRLMITSDAYCQSSRVEPGRPEHARAIDVDGENDLLWHARRRRLEGEAIRDAMLHAAGDLNLRQFGPSSRPPLPEGISKRYAWKPDSRAASHRRRSVYVLVKRNMRFPLFDAFDLPDLHSSCGERSTTTTPPQALLMMNSQLTLDLARRWAERLVALFGADAVELVSAAYREGLGRPPDGDEIALAAEFLGRAERVEPAALSVEQVAEFCHALFNANEFIYID